MFRFSFSAENNGWFSVSFRFRAQNEKSFSVPFSFTAENVKPVFGRSLAYDLPLFSKRWDTHYGSKSFTEQKFQGANRSGSELAKEWKGQGAKVLGNELARVLVAAREWKGSVAPKQRWRW